MVFHAALGAPRHEDHLADAGSVSFFDRVLDERFVHHRQHLLGAGLGGGQKAGAQTCDGKDGFANGLRFHNDSVRSGSSDQPRGCQLYCHSPIAMNQLKTAYATLGICRGPTHHPVTSKMHTYMMKFSRPQLFFHACGLASVSALALSSVSTLAAGLAWLSISLAGLGAWLGQNRVPSLKTDNETLGARQATKWWLLVCIAAFLLMAIPTIYWGGPWKERHPQWRLLIGAWGLWLLIRYYLPSNVIIRFLITGASASSLLAYFLVITVGSDEAPTNRIAWMAGTSLVGCALLSASYSLKSEDLKLRQIWLSASALMLVTVLVSGVRGSWAYLLLWPLYLWQMHRKEPALWRATWRWLIAILIAFTAASQYWGIEKDKLTTRINDIRIESQRAKDGTRVDYDNSSGARQILYTTGFEHISENTLLGTGPKELKAIIRKSLEDMNAHRHAAAVGHLHSDLLHPWVEFGIFGAAGYLAYAAGMLLLIKKTKNNFPIQSLALQFIALTHLFAGLTNMNFSHNYYPTLLSISISLCLLTLKTNKL